jgi:hypothetical protein
LIKRLRRIISSSRESETFRLGAVRASSDVEAPFGREFPRPPPKRFEAPFAPTPNDCQVRMLITLEVAAAADPFAE